jgi:hypothetical protein
MKIFYISISTNIVLQLVALFSLFTDTHSQVFNVKGTISTDLSPVRYAVIMFINKNDSSKKYSTITDSNGNYQLSVITEVTNRTPLFPQSIELAQNYPNPFSSSTSISYKLNRQSDISVTIYDILGREVEVFNVGLQTPGRYEIQWNGTHSLRSKIASGVYFYRLQTGKERHVKKMIFSGGSTTINVPPLNRFSINMRGLRKEETTQISGGTFTVQITNIGSTRPKILSAQLPDAVIQQDTTLNFQVQEAINAYSLCYQRIDSILQPDGKWWLEWDLYLNNITETNSKNFTNWNHTDEHPEWSPDGKYIAFNRAELGTYHLYLYDTANDSNICYITSDTIQTLMGMWTPDGRIVYSMKYMHDSESMYMMNPDGSNNRKIHSSPVFFYPDSYTFITGAQYLIYRTNIDGTFDELLLDLKTIGKNYVHYSDFNPYSNDLLILADPAERITNLLVKFNFDSKRIDIVSIVDSGWMYILHPKFSHDFMKIAAAEVNYADTINYPYRISILDLKNRSKATLVELPPKDSTGKRLSIHWGPFVFSSDDKYLAFSINVLQSGLMVGWISYLYVVELETKQMTLIDTGIYPEWNPKKPH